jgi:hypothetical protein
MKFSAQATPADSVSARHFIALQEAWCNEQDDVLMSADEDSRRALGRSKFINVRNRRVEEMIRNYDASAVVRSTRQCLDHRSVRTLGRKALISTLSRGESAELFAAELKTVEPSATALAQQPLHFREYRTRRPCSRAYDRAQAIGIAIGRLDFAAIALADSAESEKTKSELLRQQRTVQERRAATAMGLLQSTSGFVS